MNQYLLDTNIWIYYLKGEFQLNQKFDSVGFENLGISEVSIAELKFGAFNSQRVHDNLEVVNELIQNLNVYPILPALDIYAEQKTSLRRKGSIIDDFDLLIGATAIFNRITLVTRNEKHFQSLAEIQIENWID